MNKLQFKNITIEAHKLTRDLFKEFTDITCTYQEQFGICFGILVEESKAEKNELKKIYGTHFASIYNIKQLKSTYKRWAMVYHPDKGGDINEFRRMKEEYDYVLNILKDLVDENFDSMALRILQLSVFIRFSDKKRWKTTPSKLQKIGDDFNKLSKEEKIKIILA